MFIRLMAERGYVEGDNFVFDLVEATGGQYYQKQVTADANHGGPGAVRGRRLLYRFERTSVQFMLTQDVFTRNAIQGTKAWLNVSHKLF